MKSLEELLVNRVVSIQIHLESSKTYREQKEAMLLDNVQFWKDRIEIEKDADIQKSLFESLDSCKKTLSVVQADLKRLNELIEEIEKACNAKYGFTTEEK